MDVNTFSKHDYNICKDGGEKPARSTFFLPENGESRRVHLPICDDGLSILRPQGLSKTFSMSTRQRLYMVKTCRAVGVGICSMFSSRPLWWDSRKCLLLPHTTDLSPNWTKKRIWSLWFSTEMFSPFWKTQQCCVNVNVLYCMEVGVWYIQTRLNPLVLFRWSQYTPQRDWTLRVRWSNRWSRGTLLVFQS